MRQNVKSLLMVCAGAVVLGTAAMSQAAPLTWVPAGAGTWNTATNWTPNQAPAAGDAETISIAGTGATSILTGSATESGTQYIGSLNLNLTSTTLAAQVNLAKSTLNTVTADPIIQFNNNGSESVVTIRQNFTPGTYNNTGLQLGSGGSAAAVQLNNDVRFTSGTGGTSNGVVFFGSNAKLTSSSPHNVIIENTDNANTMTGRISTTANNNIGFTGNWVIKGSNFATATATLATTTTTNGKLYVRTDDFGAATNGVVLQGGTLDLYCGTQGPAGAAGITAAAPYVWSRPLSGTGVVLAKFIKLTGPVNIGPSAIIAGAPDKMVFINPGSLATAGLLNIDPTATLNVTGSYDGLSAPYTIMQLPTGATFTNQFTPANVTLPAGTALDYSVPGSILLTVPEPTSLALLGLGGLILMRRKRQVA